VTEHGGPARRYGDIVEARGQRGRYAFSELFRRDQAKGGRPTWLHRVWAQFARERAEVWKPNWRGLTLSQW
jgi:hypothetical protein